MSLRYLPLVAGAKQFAFACVTCPIGRQSRQAPIGPVTTFREGTVRIGLVALAVAYGRGQATVATASELPQARSMLSRNPHLYKDIMDLERD